MLDGGASMHMIGDKGSLRKIEQIAPVRIDLCNAAYTMSLSKELYLWGKIEYKQSPLCA